MEGITGKTDLEREIDVLNARLAEQNAAAIAQTDVYEPATSSGIFLTIRDQEFECRRVGTSWQMMQFSKAQQAANITIPKRIHEKGCTCHLCKRVNELENRVNKAGMLMLATLYDTAMTLLKAPERDRFKEYMEDISLSDEPLKPGELEEAIGNVIAAAGGEEPGKADTPTSPQSSFSSPIENENVSVISLADKKAANVTTADVNSSTL